MEQKQNEKEEKARAMQERQKRTGKAYSKEKSQKSSGAQKVHDCHQSGGPLSSNL